MEIPAFSAPTSARDLENQCNILAEALKLLGDRFESANSVTPEFLRGYLGTKDPSWGAHVQERMAAALAEVNQAIQAAAASTEGLSITMRQTYIRQVWK